MHAFIPWAFWHVFAWRLHCAASYIRGGGANRRLYDYNSMHGVSFHEKYEAVIIIGGGGSEVSEACICGIIEFG